MLRYYRGRAVYHTIVHSRGRIVKEGRGIGAFALPWTSIAAVPCNTQEAKFMFSARSSDFQPLKIDGDIVFRIAAPSRIAKAFDFSIDPRSGDHTSDGPDLLRRRIIALVRDVIRDETSRMVAEDLLKSESTIGRSALIRLRNSSSLRRIGVVPVGVFLKAVKLPPEVNSAIEARALQRAAMKVELGAMVANAPAWQAPSGEVQEAEEPDLSTGMECTDDCPFRLWCGDYNSYLKNGKYWCTLFREFST